MTARVVLTGIIGAGVLAAGMACARGAPVAPGAPAAITSARVMTYNIHHGAGNDDCISPVPRPGTPPGSDCGLNLERIAALIRAQNVDIVGLQEVDRFWGRSGMVDQSASLATMLGMHACYGANLDHPADLHSAAPHQYGTLVLSRYPILSCENTPLPRVETTSEQRGLLHTRIRAGDVTLQFYDTHLHVTEADRRIQVDAIVRQVGDPVGPVLLVGDLNARPTDDYLAPLFAVLNDAWVQTGSGEGFTSPALPARPPASRIDYVLASRGVAATSVVTVVTPTTAMASDHYPVVAGVALPHPRQPPPGSARRPTRRRYPDNAAGQGLRPGGSSRIEMFRNCTRLGGLVQTPFFCAP